MMIFLNYYNIIIMQARPPAWPEGGAQDTARPDKALLQGPEIYLETQDVYIAASPQPLSGEFQAIINPQLVERQGDFCVRG